MKKIIRVGILGNKWVVKIMTQGIYAHGWKSLPIKYDTREQAVQELRNMIGTGDYVEG